MIEKLKSEVELKLGKKIAYQKDCNSLSSNIFEATKEYISPATLRRLYGFLSTNSNPSRVTLDILTRYIGYNDWENFIQNCIDGNHDNNYSTFEYWNIAQENAQVICNNTIEHIALKSGIEFGKTIKRQFIKERLNSFIDSEYTATGIIAPGGYGKSTLLAQWYLDQQSLKNRNKDVILFISAQMLDQFSPTEFFIEAWLMRFLGLKPENNFLNDIPQNNSRTLGKFIIVIDALDEITSQGTKQEKVFKSLVDVVEKGSKSDKIKIIISARIATWKLFSSYIRDKKSWFLTNPEMFNGDGANIPPLNFDEIQAILDNTLNASYQNRILVHEMNPDFLKVISYPYFIQLFIKVYSPETKQALNDQLAILSEFLKKQVYYSHFSDEKTDILNQLITLSDYGAKQVLKDELKSIYPIHLKLSGNYYSAYEELCSFGIIAEETQIDTFGGYSKYIRIANQQLMHILIVQNLIRKEQGISKRLLNWVENNLIDTELQASILETLFKLAYKERLTKPLADFFELKKPILEHILSSPTIPIVLRSDNYMRNLLVPHFAQDATARKLVFEDNIDFNHLADSFSFMIKTYLNYAKNEPEKLLAKTILAHIGFVSIDTPLALFYFNEIREKNPSKLPPNVAGLWYANQVLHEELLQNGDSSLWINKASQFCTTLNSNNDRHDFAESFFPSLILINRVDAFINHIKLTDSLLSQNHRSAMNYLYSKLYRTTVECKSINTSDSNTIEQLYGFLDPLKSYQGTIIGEILRANHFLEINNLELANNCFRNAIELSNIGRYKLVEVSLMKDLATNLMRLGENQKAYECMNYVSSIWKVSGFKRYLP